MIFKIRQNYRQNPKINRGFAGGVLYSCDFSEQSMAWAMYNLKEFLEIKNLLCSGNRKINLV